MKIDFVKQVIEMIVCSNIFLEIVYRKVELLTLTLGFNI